MSKPVALQVPYLGAVVLIALLAGIPLLRFRLMSGHDTLEYLPRVVEFFEGLKAGEILPRWAPDLSAGYGQPFFNFNPPLYYFLASIFVFAGLGFVAAESLAILALLLLAGLGMYLFASAVIGRRAGLVCATAYLFAPYLLVSLYVRHALADFSAFAFLPFAFWGLYGYVYTARFRFLLIGGLSVALLLLSSNPVALITFPALLMFVSCLAYGRRAKGLEPVTLMLLRGCGLLMLGLGLSAFFWLPALVERNLVQTARLLEGHLNFRNHFVYLSQFVASPWGFGLSVPGPLDGMSFAIGPLHLSLVGASLFLLLRSRKERHKGGLLVSFFLILTLAAAFFASGLSLFVWERLPLLQILEFPWRFLSLIAVSTAFVSGFPVAMARSKWLANAITAGIIGALLLSGLSHAGPESFIELNESDYTPAKITQRGIAVTTKEEFEPIWVQTRPDGPAKERLTLVTGAARILPLGLSHSSYDFHVAVDEPARLRVNTFYFPGWTLNVDGSTRALGPTSPHGLMEFTLERGLHSVRARFSDTPIRRLGEAITMLSVVLLAIGTLAALVRRYWDRYPGKAWISPLAPVDGDPIPAAVSRDLSQARSTPLGFARDAARQIQKTLENLSSRGSETWRRIADLSPGWNWQLALLLVVGLHLVLGLVAVFWIRAEPSRALPPAWLSDIQRELVLGGTKSANEFLSIWQRWDALWYQQIAVQGYKAGDGSTAFFPLYPLVTRVFSPLVGGNVVLAQLLVSSGAFFAAMCLLYKVATLDAGHRVAQLAILMVALFPTGYFLLAPYTESLFLALALASIWFARTNRPWTAGVVGSLAAFARFQGVFLAIVLAIEFIRHKRSAGERLGAALLASVLPVLSYLALGIRHFVLLGEPYALFGTQRDIFGYQVVLPWESIASSLRQIVERGDAIEAFNLACLMGFTGLALASIRRLPLAYTLYIWPSLLILFFRQMWFSPLMSVSRFVLVLFPCFIVLASYMERRPRLAASWLCISLIFQVALFLQFVQWSFVA